MAKVDFVGIIKTSLTSSFWVWVLVVGKDQIIIEQNCFYSSYHFAAAFFSEHIAHVLSDRDSPLAVPLGVVQLFGVSAASAQKTDLYLRAY